MRLTINHGSKILLQDSCEKGTKSIVISALEELGQSDKKKINDFICIPKIENPIQN
jgi:hypothetical protein